MQHTLLVVDDDEQIRKLCRKTLERRGYLVKEASNGKEALTAIKKTTFTLVVLDLSMPDMDGFEFMKAVRGEFPNLRIIVMSGFIPGTMLKMAKQLGGTATLAKPFSPDSLLLLVAEVLEEDGPDEESSD